MGRLIGQGGMSDVYEAVDERTGASVAVKVVRSGDPDFARRLAQEARGLERLRHPGLVRLLDTGFSGSHAYLVMDLVAGSTLSELLRRGPLSTERTATLGAGLAGALSYVHGQAIVHRDVKPSNILVTPEGEGRLGDFGIARLLDTSTLTMTGTTLGTAAYMAPEQLENNQVGPSADIWSLGIVLLECLTGRRIYEGSPNEVVAMRLAGPVPLPNNLPVAWKLILTGMLDHRPEQRLQSAEVASLLATPPFRAPWNLDESSPTEQLTTTLPHDLTALAPTTTAILTGRESETLQATPPHVSQPRHNQWVKVAALLALVASGLFVGWLLGNGTSPTTGHHPVQSVTNPVRHSSTTLAPATAKTTSPTVTTIPNAATALAALVRDVASGVAAGSVGPKAGQSVANQAQKAVTDESAGNATQAATDLQQAATTISDGVQNGKITPAQGVTLQTDLSRLAALLGLAQALTPPTTQPPGNGHGDGGANGNGGG